MIKHKIKKRAAIICGAIIIAIATVSVFCLSMVNTINQLMNESAISNLLSTTQVMTDTLEGLIKKDYKSLNVLATLCANDQTPDANQLLAFRETMELDWIGIVDEYGNGIDCFENTYVMSEYPETAGWNLKEESYSNAYIGVLSGRSQITIWVPVYKDERYIGSVLGNVILTQYYSANVFTFYEGLGRTYIFDASNGDWILKSLGTDGASIKHDNIYSLLTASNNKEQNIKAFKETVEGKKTGATVFNFNGEQSYLCFMPLPSSPNWYLTTVIARDVLLRESSEVQRIIKLVLTILCTTLAASAVILAVWLVQTTKAKEAYYREALFANLSANLDSAFLIYEKSSKKTAFVSDNIHRLLGLDRESISEDAGRLFDWCKISKGDSRRTQFLDGTLVSPSVSELHVENELGENIRAIRLELIPADLGQELAVITDITNQKDIQRSLIDAMQSAKAASNAKNDFMSSMSHDLRTPINNIVGMTTIAASHLDDKNRVMDCLSKISGSSVHLLNLINEVLDMSQIESGRLELASEPFNIAQLLQDVLNSNYPGIEQKEQTIRVRVRLMEHERVIGDSVCLTRIVANLISNSIKYTPTGGTITLELREKESVMRGFGCYELTVQDNGIGMSPEFLEHLYEPFEREDDVKRQKIQGTGLGLSIVKNMVELMMGSIQVESQKNKGTTFKVTVNLQLDNCEAESVGHLADLSVLVVDDDIDACKTTTEILCSIGMNAEWIDNGIDAVRLAVDRHESGSDYMVIILDWKMPVLDGVETARRIRTEVGAHIPIIVLTAYDWSEIETEAREVGIDDFISKPIYKDKLIKKMTSVTKGQSDTCSPLPSAYAKTMPQGKRVLLAEDNELNREIAIEILKTFGIDIDCVENGAYAVERFAASETGFYDLILMDIQMPKMNGYDAARAIRGLDRFDSKTVPIIAMTADAFQKDKQSAIEAGMNDHLSKPISIELFADTLRRFLSDSKAEIEVTINEK